MFQNLEIITPKRIQFRIKDIDLAFVNAIRRIILAEIPNVAFNFDYNNTSDINIINNTGVLHNEFIAHRISLIPLHFDENDINNNVMKDYTFKLHVYNKTADIVNITTKNFEIFDANNKKINADQIFPINEFTKNHILITKLKPNYYDNAIGEELKLECKTSINIAKTHSRWCPVSQCCFNNVVDDELANKVLKNKIKELNMTSKTDIDNLTSNFNTLEIFRHFKKNKYDEPCEFDFKIETECKLRPIYLVFKAFLILKQKVQSFIDNTDKNNNIVVFKQVGQIDNFFEINIADEDHTLLNVLQCQIFNTEIRAKTDSNLEYIGYYQPHPLNNVMTLKIKFNTSKKVDIDFAKKFMKESSTKIIVTLDEIIRQWIEFSQLKKTDIIEVQNYLTNS